MSSRPCNLPHHDRSTLPPRLALLALSLLLFHSSSASADESDLPTVSDPRLQLSLFASDPDIVTPIGLAIDAAGRLFVLESHTHSPPRDYPGPNTDRIKILTDSDGDGRPDSIALFADGFNDGMNLAFSPDGTLFLVTAREVWAFHDRDNDGRSESRTRILQLLTPEPPYEHAALLGITFAHDGWLYISRGNTGGLRYTFKGSDDSTITGYGDGGSIIRCRPDGSALQEVATGFWNPFDIKFDPAGRLLCVDNDPDARGPNRLLHIIPGGDYGYKSLFGGGGNHPYQAWNADLPGTLPILAGLGEAPCGLIHAAFTSLPADYHDTVLCTVWGEHNLTRARLSPQGASLSARTDILIEGGQDFRPVAIAADRAGIVYFTDWVQRDYPNHGKGRIWRLSTRPGHETITPRSYFAPPIPDPSLASLDRLLSASAIEHFPALRSALASDDPFLRSAAVTALARPLFRAKVMEATTDADPDIRLGALLALRRATHPGPDPPYPIARRLLADPDPRIRRMTLIWIGEQGMLSLRPHLATAISTPDLSAPLFETYLATLEILTPDFIKAYRSRSEASSKRLSRQLDPTLIESLIHDPANPAILRALALTRLRNPEKPENLEALRSLLRANETRLQLEAVRTLAITNHPEAAPLLLTLARDRSAPPDARAEAILALTYQPAHTAAHVARLLDDLEPAVHIEAARFLRSAVSDPAIRAIIADKHRAIRDDAAHAPLLEQLQFILFPPATAPPLPAPPRPQSLEEWQDALATGGDPPSGRRIFFSLTAGCSQCHTIHNRGGQLGPDLSLIGLSRDRNQLIHSILRPSDEFSIDYQAWYIKTRDGSMHLGLQLDLQDRGDIELFTLEGKTVRFKTKDILSYGASKKSLMPDGLEAGLAISDFRDLIAFLESLR